MKKLINNIIENLIIILSPSTWITILPYCDMWDSRLRGMMESGHFEEINEFTAKIGEAEIWIASHPFASFSTRGVRLMPSRKTVRTARKKLIADYLAQQKLG